MPNLLPAASHKKLQSALKSGRMPKYGKPGFDDAYDVYMDLWIALGSDATRKLASEPRREVGSLINFWNALPTDGMLIGVVVNNAPLVPVALAAATSMKLPRHARILEQTLAYIPPTLMKLSIDKRLAWTETPEAAPSIKKLEKLEETAQSESLVNGIMEACLKRTLAEPDEFFKTSQKK